MLHQSLPGHASLSGVLDMQNCASLLIPLTCLVKESPLQLDLSEVKAADSAALALLLAVQRAAQQAGHTLIVQNWPEGLRTLLDLYSMSDLFSSIRE